jgi:uncharacterized coiled-coil protein SlyX
VLITPTLVKLADGFKEVRCSLESNQQDVAHYVAVAANKIADQIHKIFVQTASNMPTKTELNSVVADLQAEMAWLHRRLASVQAKVGERNPHTVKTTKSTSKTAIPTKKAYIGPTVLSQIKSTRQLKPTVTKNRHSILSAVRQRWFRMQRNMNLGFQVHAIEQAPPTKPTRAQRREKSNPTIPKGIPSAISRPRPRPPKSRATANGLSTSTGSNQSSQVPPAHGTQLHRADPSPTRMANPLIAELTKTIGNRKPLSASPTIKKTSPHAESTRHPKLKRRQGQVHQVIFPKSAVSSYQNTNKRSSQAVNDLKTAEKVAHYSQGKERTWVGSKLPSSAAGHGEAVRNFNTKMNDKPALPASVPPTHLLSKALLADIRSPAKKKANNGSPGKEFTKRQGVAAAGTMNKCDTNGESPTQQSHLVEGNNFAAELQKRHHEVLNKKDTSDLAKTRKTKPSMLFITEKVPTSNVRQVVQLYRGKVPSKVLPKQSMRTHLPGKTKVNSSLLSQIRLQDCQLKPVEEAVTEIPSEGSAQDRRMGSDGGTVNLLSGIRAGVNLKPVKLRKKSVNLLSGIRAGVNLKPVKLRKKSSVKQHGQGKNSPVGSLLAKLQARKKECLIRQQRTKAMEDDW